MKLTHRYDCYLELNEYLSHEYHCELTKELDDLAGFDKKMIDEYEYGHYILATEADMKQRLLYTNSRWYGWQYIFGQSGEYYHEDNN